MAARDLTEAEILAEFRATTVVFASPDVPKLPLSVGARRKAIQHAADRGLTGAELREAARRLEAEMIEADAVPSRTQTAEEYDRSVQFALRHDRRVRQMQSLLPKPHLPAGTSRRVRPAQRRREQRPRRLTRSTPSRGDPHLPAGDDDEIDRLRGHARAAGMVHISELLGELLNELQRWAA